MNPDTAPHSVVRMSEVVSALSSALDIVEGQPEGHAVRTCLIGMRLAEVIGLPADQRSALFYALLLKDLGCSSNAARVCYLFGAADHAVKRDFKTTDWVKLTEQLAYIRRNVAPDGSFWEKLKRVVTLARAGSREAKHLVRIRCERGAGITAHLGLPSATAQAIRNLDEHWDGRGHPDGLRGDEIPRLARVVSLAQTTEVFVSRFGVEAALDMAEARSGRWFDPRLVRTLVSLRDDETLWDQARADDPARFLGSHEPQDRIRLADDSTLDRLCEAFGQVIDAKSPWTAAHSSGVATIAEGIGSALGYTDAELCTLRRAGQLHDIGKLGISSRILDKPGRLTDAERREIERHPAYTLHILGRVRCFRGFADLAASHHERLDGAGYHRGLTGDQLSPLARALVVADMYEALAARRPYRPELTPTDVHEILRRSVGTAICPDAYSGLEHFLDASGFQPARLVA